MLFLYESISDKIELMMNFWASVVSNMNQFNVYLFDTKILENMKYIKKPLIITPGRWQDTRAYSFDARLSIGAREMSVKFGKNDLWIHII